VFCRGWLHYYYTPSSLQLQPLVVGCLYILIRKGIRSKTRDESLTGNYLCMYLEWLNTLYSIQYFERSMATVKLYPDNNLQCLLVAEF